MYDDRFNFLNNRSKKINNSKLYVDPFGRNTEDIIKKTDNEQKKIANKVSKINKIHKFVESHSLNEIAKTFLNKQLQKLNKRKQKLTKKLKKASRKNKQQKVRHLANRLDLISKKIKSIMNEKTVTVLNLFIEKKMDKLQKTIKN